MNELERRERVLMDQLGGLTSVIVAYSGGVDSAYVAWAATQVLGARALCITADSPSYPAHHRQMAVSIARDFGLQVVWFLIGLALFRLVWSRGVKRFSAVGA